VKIGQIALILGALVVTAGLYLMPFSPLASKEASETENAKPASTYSILDDVTAVNNELDSSTLAVISRYETELERKGEVAYRDSLIGLYDMLRKPIPSSFHALKKAEQTNGVDAWTEAGERFLLNAKYIGEANQKTAWFTTSKECFEKGSCSSTHRP
jgi:hypothetical protein